MSFNKDYPNRKDWRKPYNPGSAKDVDVTCRNHGSCPWCKMCRKHKHRRRMPVEINEEATK